MGKKKYKGLGKTFDRFVMVDEGGRQDDDRQGVVVIMNLRVPQYPVDQS
jgi:hypothetical protein